MYRILLLCREGHRLISDTIGMRWEYVLHWHTWTIEDTLEDAQRELERLRIGLNPMVRSAKIIGADEYYWNTWIR